MYTSPGPYKRIRKRHVPLSPPPNLWICSGKLQRQNGVKQSVGQNYGGESFCSIIKVLGDVHDRYWQYGQLSSFLKTPLVAK